MQSWKEKCIIFQSLIPVNPKDKLKAEIPGGEAEAFITPNSGT